jgi:hypothetical protein
MTTTNNNTAKIEHLNNKLANIKASIEECQGKEGSYYRRKVLKLNELAEKTENQLKELTK